MLSAIEATKLTQTGNYCCICASLTAFELTLLDTIILDHQVPVT